MKKLGVLFITATLSFASAAEAVITVPSDGSDGAFSPTANKVVDLSLAPTATWDTPGNSTTQVGVYDPTKWAVVYKFSSVNIPSGVTVTFKNHPADAPVVWLVQGNVTITGTVSLDGQSGLTNGFFAEPGPGGFRGGATFSTTSGSGGFGPGGGLFTSVGGGSYATAGGVAGGPVYGNARILPLIGGSGGAGRASNNHGGGAGGGAILIVAGGTITVTGTLRANGGTTGDCNNAGGGSGGAIRLVADSIVANGPTLQAYPYCLGGARSGGFGRIRLEANTINITGNINGDNSSLFPLTPQDPVVWPATANPVVQIATVGGQAVPTDPHADFVVPGDIFTSTSSSVPVTLQTSNVPTTWVVALRLVRKSGADYVVNATRVSGDSLAATWTATLQPLPASDFVAIQARTYKP